MRNGKVACHLFKLISKITIFFSLFIIFSSLFTRQLMEGFTGCYGEETFVILIGLILILAGLAFLFFFLKDTPGLKKNLLLLVLLITGLGLAWQMKLPQERIHILEFGLLGWFASRDLITKNKKGTYGVGFAWLFVLTIGFFDELFQLFLPYRFWDLRDIMFNSLGGLWGIGLYYLKKII